jgi:hypothetical protein
MGRNFAYAHKSGSRPYGQPGDDRNFRDSTPRPQTVGTSRNVTRVNPTSVFEPIKVPEVYKCSALTRSGNPCKGRPVAGGDLCAAHKE